MLHPSVLADRLKTGLARFDTSGMTHEQQSAGSDPERPSGTPQRRTPIVFDPATKGLRIGEHVRRVDDPSQSDQVYGAYLALLYAVRGAKPGEQLPLRTADLEALLHLVGDDPKTIEQRGGGGGWGGGGRGGGGGGGVGRPPGPPPPPPPPHPRPPPPPS